jgi:pimeloyl-ACP methyl ester carboxylesterase
MLRPVGEGTLLTPDDWRAQGRTFQHRGYPIFYRDDGSGDVVLCIHGFPTASYDWHRIWEPLRARFRLIAPDMIGFGFSAKPPEYDYSLMDQATLHETLLRELGVRQVHVLAHDYGVSVAQELLARDLDRKRTGTAGVELRSVCLLNGGLFPETHHAQPVQELLAGPMGRQVARMMNAESFAQGFTTVFGPQTQPTPAELRDFWTLVDFNDGPGVMHLLIGYIAERRRQRERWVGALQTTTVPLRLVNGPEDPVSGGHMVVRYRELVPHPDVVMLDGIGHYPQVEDPDGVLRAWLEFVDRVAARGVRPS